MKLRQIYFLFFLYLSTSFPQVFDSSKINPIVLGDSAKSKIDTLAIGDSTKIILPDSSAADSLAIFSSLKNKALVDTLIPLYQQPLSPGSSFISHKSIIRTDYENTGDILKLFPFTFVNETGLYGHPDDVFLYGVYPDGISYLKNNIQMNNSYVGGFDLNLIQSETIDSIEMINLPRGFLYSINDNPVSVNFIEKDFLSIAPNSRIKYYEGPYGKALFDGIFNTILYKRFNLFVDITNRKGDDSYKNSNYGIWQATFKLKYHLSNKLNLTGSYSYVKSEVGLNGGVDVDSISKVTKNIAGSLYDVISAPVNSLTGRQNVTGDNFGLNALWNPAAGLNTDVKLYYLFSQNVLTDIYGDSSQYKNRYSRYGVNINQVYTAPLFKLNLIGNYEQGDNDQYDIYYPNGIDIRSESHKHITFAAIATTYLVDSLITPSIFYKYSSHGVNSSMIDGNGIGLDINFSIPGLFKIYVGYSSFSIANTTSMEAGLNIKNDYLLADLRYFSIADYSFPYFFSGSVNGMGLKLNYSLGKFLLESNMYYLFDIKTESEIYLDRQKKYNIDAGIYYKDILFKSNLDLKAGFRFYLSDNKLDGPVEPSSPFTALYPTNNYRLDFTLSGVIRKVAIVYFTWENLTNNQYFIVPYYPMPERNIRFGIAWDLFN